METFRNDCSSDIGNLPLSCCYRLKGLLVLLLYLFVSFAEVWVGVRLERGGGGAGFI